MVSGFYKFAKKSLSEKGFEDAVFEARCITCKAFNISAEQLLSQNIQCNDEDSLNCANAMLKKRLEGFPLQYILGKWEFFGLEFKVGKGVLIPRADTEILVETALDIIADKDLKIVDLCSGSGCIAISVSKNSNCSVTAVEISDDALKYLKNNASLNNADIDIIKADVLDENTAMSFDNIDIILSNPPYLTANDMKMLQKEVTFEPQNALFGGNDGLEFYRKITQIWKHSLKSEGYILFEVGINQSDDVSKILIKNGFKSIKCVNDLNGIPRVVCAKL